MAESHDVAVVGGTPGGIAAAVRAAREGNDTLLAAYHDHIGGMMASGLSYTDTLTMKARAPVLEEFVAGVRDHYRERYGEDSEQYAYCEDGYVFEPHVAEQVFERLVEDEGSLTVRRGVAVAGVERNGDSLDAVSLSPLDSGTAFTVESDVFVEATYEGDLAAAAGVPCRIGREDSAAHGERFAGRLFTSGRTDQYYPRAAVGDVDNTAPPDRRGPLATPPEQQQGDLDLIPHPCGLTELLPESTGEGDDAVQAYSYRLCLSRDPETRRRPEKPDGYDRSEYLGVVDSVAESGLRRYLTLRYLPNGKADMNAADMPGESHAYPEAGWERRQEIADRHRRHALGLLYFLQNDDAVPESVRAEAREWGLAADEFTDNDNFPWQLYVREGRRIDGRYTFSEGDARHARGLDRTPVHDDSIAVAEYPLDSHACRTETQPGSWGDGCFYASQVTRPSQVPYRSILPEGVDNLLVPVPLSATHVGFGTIRLEPTWMHIGESAGVAAALARTENTSPAVLQAERVQRALLDRDVMLSFFNEFDAATDEPWGSAVQYLGTKGFFGSYDARPADPLTERVAGRWARLAAQLAAGGRPDATATARQVCADAADGAPVSPAELTQTLRTAFESRGLEPALDTTDVRSFSTGAVTRGEACRVVYDLLATPSER
jgi:hypothetical protein